MRQAATNTDLPSPHKLGIPITIDGMVHHHPGRLHVGVADSRADEGEPGFFQGLAHRLGFRSDGRDFTAILEMVHFWRACDERPDKRDRVFQPQPGLGVLARGVEFEAIANDAGFKHQVFDLSVSHGCDPAYVEVEHHFTIAGAFLQNGDPRQAGLEPFEQ